MSWLASAFAPRKDHKGMSTPSYAARWWLLLCTAVCALWSWQATDGFLVMAAALTVMVATPALSFGWYLIGLISARFSRLVRPTTAERGQEWPGAAGRGRTRRA